MTNRYVGSPTLRIEDLRFLRGRGQYADDLHLPNMLFATLLRSSVARGLIKSVDVERARQHPGIHAIITARDLPTPRHAIPLRMHSHESLYDYRQPVLALDEVRFVGEPIVLVLAETAALAEDALELIDVVIQSTPADAVARQSPIAITYTGTRGETDSTFAKADYVRSATFNIQRQTALPMEPRGLVAEWTSDDRLVVYGAAKVAFANRVILAEMLGIPVSAIELHELDVGGGFGSRGEFYPEDFLIPFAARLTRRPIKWTEDRREHLQASNHARDVECHCEIACLADGTVLALRGHADVDVGAYMRTNGSVGPRNLAQAIAGPYRVPHIRMDVSVRITNKTPTGTYRGPGRYEADFVRERLFDMAARDLGIEQAAFRRLNLLRSEELPCALPSIDPIPQMSELDTGDYAETLDRCLVEIGWADKLALQGQLLGHVYHGLAVGCFIEGGGVGPSEDARVAVEPNGTVIVYVGSSAIGQGLETILAQIAADCLGLDIGCFIVRHGSTAHVRNGHGSYGSRSTVMGGSAVLLAAENLKLQLKIAAANRFLCTSDAITLSGGIVISPDGQSTSIFDLGEDSIVGEATFYNNKTTYSYGAQAAHVTVDSRTGQVAIVDYVSVEDVGRIINALTVHGQSIGAIVQGLGGALLEEIAHDDDGQLLTGSLADYLVPTATDFPSIRSITLENYPASNNPLGAKGAGEGGIIPVAGVVANAVAAALATLGVSPLALPLSPQRIWALMQAGA